ncbi:bifunctional phosphopantothenoylcysteine decarboxylase/phosphopantothenate synthase [Helicobacter cinaedi PAGU611]|uniref:bifunctional phosphopantothenoylcysteine decarboxylase/phosphopantothenate--cysteine ligase CoaBC n=1 Tax=Helicobacter cinaedi TaxID=213 RepID=UPI00025D3615|nr:bifunctional phosphopantothenoylcysteine decarboxylase/phosphopantothenate--cysteine ligase CoaBC [Helicobacter cinaedi]BAM15108.1 bifunctional phosphopantothenoylcysteine decarboxylase/phosphopantothenate synthase [Helicobacter cinaedi PAGU611]BBB21037.1 phosphopantothenoylcysteine decarboxylase [Helicobacter cinaedi]
MQHIFHNKNVLILISGSIAAYKMLDCISQLKKYNANIKVVMSKEACKFVSPLSFEAMSGNLVLTEHNQSWVTQSNVVNGANHIAYARWADIVLIAPASANSIAKIACGIADNVLLTTLLATRAKKLIAPAMNTAMLESPQTQANLTTLKNLGFECIESRSSLLACGEMGDGALAEIDEIIFRLARGLHTNVFWQGRDVIISGGGSKESIDEVRFISNHSSGKQASALAIAFYTLGAKVSFVSSVFPCPLPKQITQIAAQSVADFHTEIHKLIKQAESKPFVFMAAALADYAPKPQKSKLKKEQVGETLTLQCFQTQDVLFSISLESAYKIGFKAEMDRANAPHYAKTMLDSKQCDMVCLNVIGEQNPFGANSNTINIFTHDFTQGASGSKLEVAFSIAKACESLTKPSNDSKNR